MKEGELLRAVERINELASRVTRILMGTIILAVLLVMAFNVVMRYVIGSSLRWAEEISAISMVWLVFLGAGHLARTGKHISIEAIYDLLPRTGKRVLAALTGLTVFTVSLFLFWYAVKQVGTFLSRGTIFTASNLPAWVAYAVIPVGFVLIALGTLEHYARIVVRQPETSGAADKEKNRGGS